MIAANKADVLFLFRTNHLKVSGPQYPKIWETLCNSHFWEGGFFRLTVRRYIITHRSLSGRLH